MTRDEARDLAQGAFNSINPVEADRFVSALERLGVLKIDEPPAAAPRCDPLALKIIANHMPNPGDYMCLDVLEAVRLVQRLDEAGFTIVRQK